mmetsp:Transcript_20907/g.53419  ORF Transcript_20907/g.53419 Transcript_20907/m.53419 type:complete len:203 (-) Transcript_20907:321-929(-)
MHETFFARLTSKPYTEFTPSCTQRWTCPAMGVGSSSKPSYLEARYTQAHPAPRAFTESRLELRLLAFHGGLVRVTSKVLELRLGKRLESARHVLIQGFLGLGRRNIDRHLHRGLFRRCDRLLDRVAHELRDTLALGSLDGIVTLLVLVRLLSLLPLLPSVVRVLVFGIQIRNLIDVQLPLAICPEFGQALKLCLRQRRLAGL